MVMTPSDPFSFQVFSFEDKLQFIWDPLQVPSVNAQETREVKNGPLVKMIKAAAPISMKIGRDSFKNGEHTIYEFTVVPRNPVNDGNKIILTFPPEISIKSTAIATGVSTNLKRSLTSRVVSTNQITITVSTSGSRRLGQIAAQEEFTFKVSDVKNPPSTRPTLESIVYLMVDKQGNTLEEKLEGLEIRNTVAGDFVEGQSSVQPSSFDGGVANRYSFAFKPTNYEQDMLVKIKSPSTIPVESVDNVVCFGEEGTDT